MQLVNTVCYRVKEPTVYNRGTVWEKKEYEFLASYGDDDIQEHMEHINRLNNDMEYRRSYCEKHRIDCDNRADFFHNAQEPFDTRD